MDLLNDKYRLKISWINSAAYTVDCIDAWLSAVLIDFHKWYEFCLSHPYSAKHLTDKVAFNCSDLGSQSFCWFHSWFRWVKWLMKSSNSESNSKKFSRLRSKKINSKIRFQLCKTRTLHLKKEEKKMLLKTWFHLRRNIHAIALKSLCEESNTAQEILNIFFLSASPIRRHQTRWRGFSYFFSKGKARKAAYYSAVNWTWRFLIEDLKESDHQSQVPAKAISVATMDIMDDYLWLEKNWLKNRPESAS